MRAFFDHASVVYDGDFVGAADGGKPVRRHERRAALRKFRQRFLHVAFAFVVEGARRFVQDQDRWVFRNTRAIEMRCFCPPDKRAPRSPT